MALIAVVALLIIAVDGAYLWVANKLEEIPRVPIAGLTPADPGDPQNTLVVGSDSRANETPEAAQHFGTATDVSGQRSDTIVLIHVDPRTAKAALLFLCWEVLGVELP